MATIQIKKSTTAGNTPASLLTAELALNVTDGMLFFGNGSTVKKYPALPLGGTAGQVPIKNSSADGDASWGTLSGGGGPAVAPWINAALNNAASTKVATIGTLASGDKVMVKIIGGKDNDVYNDEFILENVSGTAVYHWIRYSNLTGAVDQTGAGNLLEFYALNSSGTFTLYLSGKSGIVLNGAIQATFITAAGSISYYQGPVSYSGTDNGGTNVFDTDTTKGFSAPNLFVDPNGNIQTSGRNVSVPTGGTTGQGLVKNSNTNGDYGWNNVLLSTRLAAASGVASLDANSKIPVSQLSATATTYTGATTTLLTTDRYVRLDTTSNAINATLPASPANGQELFVKVVGVNYAYLLAASGETIDSVSTLFLPGTAADQLIDTAITLRARTAGWEVVSNTGVYPEFKNPGALGRLPTANPSAFIQGRTIEFVTAANWGNDYLLETVIVNIGSSVYGQQTIYNFNTGDVSIRQKPYPGSDFWGSWSLLTNNVGPAIYGDGHDGAAVFDGTNTFSWATKSGSTYTINKDIYLTSCNVGSSAVLRPNGYRIFVNGTMTNNGIISNAGVTATSITAGNGLSGNTIGGSGAGGNGGNSGAGVAANNISAAAGGAGGAGGTNATAGGAGGTATAPTAAQGGLDQFITLPALLNMVFKTASTTISTLTGAAGGGGGGANATSSTGGGGGGGGGPVAIYARFLAGNGSINVAGGNGAAGQSGNAAGGGGGGGGTIVIVSESIPTSVYWTSTNITTPNVPSWSFNMSGGTGGASIGTGTTTAAANGSNGRYMLIRPTF